MPLGTLDRSPPPFFRQGASKLSKLILFGMLALLLMVADKRFGAIEPLRSGIATLIYPLQWAVLQPVVWLRQGHHYFESLTTSRAHEAQAQYWLGLQSQRAQQVEQLSLENSRLRALLGLRARVNVPALAAQVLYDAADPFARKVIIDKGAIAAVSAGAPVLDEFGVLGQVTRVYQFLSEVTLLTDRNQAIPVLSVRTGLRALAFGTGGLGADALELRFLDASADLALGDVFATSGIDGVYPPGLQVARVSRIERRNGALQVYCTPVAATAASLHVLVLDPLAQVAPPASAPGASGVSTKSKKGAP